MGWSGCHQYRKKTYKELQEYIRSEWESYGDFKVLKMHIGLGESYLILERQKGNDTIKEGTRFACVTLIKNNNNEIMTKDMSEDMMPYYYNMPLSYLDLLSEPLTEGCKTWRNNVREWHRIKKMVNSPKDGDVIILPGLCFANRVTSASKYIKRIYRIDHARIPEQYRKKKVAIYAGEICVDGHTDNVEAYFDSENSQLYKWSTIYGMNILRGDEAKEFMKKVHETKCNSELVPHTREEFYEYAKDHEEYKQKRKMEKNNGTSKAS